MVREVWKGHAVAAMCLGILELLCGISIIVITLVATSKADISTKTAPWWVGIFFVVPGVLGIIVGCKRRFKTMMSYMVTNLIAFVLQGISAIWICLQIVIYADIFTDASSNCVQETPSSCRCRTARHNVLIHGVPQCVDFSTFFNLIVSVLVLLMIAALLALSGSILGCSAICCFKRSQDVENNGVVYCPQYPQGQEVQLPPPYTIGFAYDPPQHPPQIMPYLYPPPPYHLKDPIKT